MIHGDIVARRRRCAMTTRGEILDAARRRFIDESYETVGLRDIAGDVGVDVALIGRYFGSKDALFREVMSGCDDAEFNSDIRAADLPAFLASLVAAEDGSSHGEHRDKTLIALRSASSPVASGIVRDAVKDSLLEPLAQILDSPDAEQRASLAAAILFGTTVLRTIMAMEPLCEKGDNAALHDRLVRLFEAALAPARETTRA